MPPMVKVTRKRASGGQEINPLDPILDPWCAALRCGMSNDGLRRACVTLSMIDHRLKALEKNR